jgi:Transcriptional regulators
LVSINSKEIAKIAGVSRSTVSRVINNYKNVPEETKNKVLSVVEKYNYVPHEQARMLAGGKNKIIGLFMVDRKLYTVGKNVSMSNYFSLFLNRVIDEANKYGYYVLAYSITSPKDYKAIKQIFFNHTISGGIFIGQQYDDENLNEIIQGGYKVVMVDKEIEFESELVSKSFIINTDNTSGAYSAIKYLIELGHRKIAHISGHRNQLSTTQRIEGYKKALEEAGITYNRNLVLNGNFIQDGGYSATKKLLQKETPTAIFYANDSMAIGGLIALKELSIHVPQEMSVIGFDDIEIASYLDPALTTVKTGFAEMASIAVSNLITAIKEDSSFSAHYIVPAELIIRDSCAHL